MRTFISGPVTRANIKRDEDYCANYGALTFFKRRTTGRPRPDVNALSFCCIHKEPIVKLDEYTVLPINKNSRKVVGWYVCKSGCDNNAEL